MGLKVLRTSHKGLPTRSWVGVSIHPFIPWDDSIPRGTVSGQAKGTVKKVSDQFKPREDILLRTALVAVPIGLKQDFLLTFPPDEKMGPIGKIKPADGNACKYFPPPFCLYPQVEIALLILPF